MTIAKILAPVTGSKRDRSILATAIEAARPFDAHVVALFVHPDPREGILSAEYGLPLSAAVVQELIDDAETMTQSASKAARAALAEAASAAGIRLTGKPERGDGVTASYRESFGDFRDRVREAAKLADLVVFAPILQTDKPAIGETLIAIIAGSEKPVLLSPEVPPKSVGKHVAIGWDGGQAAAHALTAAVPFLERAEDITLLSVQDAPVQGAKCMDAAEYLRLHGLSCTEHDIRRGPADIGEKIMAEAVALGCDLLVVGGYGHSRLREAIFGGATARIISHATLPVLLVH